ncbi:MAG: hypothetical protein U9R79_17620 [Armatimonadota bacterium]|nr:hypothetical protein [Armatimonadota bacterium]
MNNTERQAAVDRAAEHIFSMGLGDVAARMSELNMAYGLAKMHLVQEELGGPPDATFVGTPDLTITRNEARWGAGIGYGGRITWGDGELPVVFLDVKPNCCGMLVGGLGQPPELRRLVRRLDAMLEDHAELDGVPIDWDIGTGNHFVDLMAVEPVDPEAQLPPWCFVLHFSGAELRGENPLGMGLYWDGSAELRRRMRVFDTPWGPCRTLLDDDAREYWQFFQRAERFARQRRLMAAERLFGDFEIIANLHHQGLMHQNAMLLGCQDTSAGGLVPVMLRENTPGYLFHALPNLADEVIDVLGWRERAVRHGVLDRLQSANVIPHGAGYMLPDLATVAEVHEIDGRRYYEVESAQGGVRIVLGTPRHLTYAYRGRRVILASAEYRLGEIAARLQPVSVLKA